MKKSLLAIALFCFAVAAHAEDVAVPAQNNLAAGLGSVFGTMARGVSHFRQSFTAGASAAFHKGEATPQNDTAAADMSYRPAAAAQPGHLSLIGHLRNRLHRLQELQKRDNGPAPVVEQSQLADADTVQHLR